MEFFPVVQGRLLPEVYHFGFNGTQFEIFLTPAFWTRFLDLAGAGTPYAENQGPEYVPPSVFCNSFGLYKCAEVSKTLDGLMCIKVPAFPEKEDEEGDGVTIRSLGHTLSSILYLLENILYETDKWGEEAEQGELPQLFVVETFVAIKPGQFHGAGLGLSLSPLARRYLEGIGEGHRLEDAVESMEEHYFDSTTRRGHNVRLFRGSMEVRISTKGVLHMHTVGNCACLGTAPENFGDGRGCYLDSHNVDTVSQQFNLLVGVASVWQIVRDGLRE